MAMSYVETEAINTSDTELLDGLDPFLESDSYKGPIEDETTCIPLLDPILDRLEAMDDCLRSCGEHTISHLPLSDGWHRCRDDWNLYIDKRSNPRANVSVLTLLQNT
jgi:hypothetical protein